VTREEAIARIELVATEMTGTLAATTEPSAAEVLQRYIDVYDMAIAALREQDHIREVTKMIEPCEWCRHFEGDSRSRIYLLSEGNGMYKEAMFEFCPMCGRRLEEV
jgi:hypothetical protein